MRARLKNFERCHYWLLNSEFANGSYGNLQRMLRYRVNETQIPKSVQFFQLCLENYESAVYLLLN